jgi:hypothetical protein
LALAALAAAVPPQARPKIPPPDFQRETETDAAGLVQFKAFDLDCTHCKGAKSQVCEHCKDSPVPICLECDGTKRATCRICGGIGKLPDPLLELACPICRGSSWYVCGICNSFGFLTVEGNKTNCGACKQKGLLACLACGGRRRLDTVKAGAKPLTEASVKDLQALLARLHACQAAFEAYEPDPNPSRSLKEFAKCLEPVKRDLGAAKDLVEMLETVIKGIKSYGAGYAAYQDMLLHQFLLYEDRTVYLLQHQVRAAEQGLARAESNASK